MIRVGLRIHCQSQQKLLNLSVVLSKLRNGLQSKYPNFSNCQRKISLHTTSFQRKISLHTFPSNSQRQRNHFSQRQQSLTQGVFYSSLAYRNQLTNHSICHRVHIARQISNSFVTSNKSGNSDETSDEEQPAEWVHPSAREDSILKTDDKLKSFLHDLASDFGENVSNSIHEENNNGPAKAAKVRIPFDDVVYFDGSGGDGGFGRVEVGLDEDLQQIQQDGNDDMGSIKRTSNGVLTVSEIVDILREDNARDICVIKVPKAKQYVDYFVIVTGRSTRHLKAMAGYLNKIYKHLKQRKHPFIKIEGQDTDDWMCIDFGDIVVHFMLKDTRELYQLEMLWTLGPEHDDQYHRIVQYQSDLITPVLPTEEELETMESVTTEEGYNVVIEQEGTAQLPDNRRI